MAAPHERARATAEAFLENATISLDSRSADAAHIVSASAISADHPRAGRCCQVTVTAARVVSQALIEIELQPFHKDLLKLGAFLWEIKYTLLSGNALVSFTLTVYYPDEAAGLSPLAAEAGALPMTVQPMSYWLKAMPKARDAAHCAELIAVAQFAYNNTGIILQGAAGHHAVGYDTASNASVVGLWAYLSRAVLISSATLEGMPALNFGKLVLDYKSSEGSSGSARPELFASVMLSVPVRAAADPRREIWDSLVPPEYKQTEQGSRDRHAARRRAEVGPEGHRRDRSRSRERSRERQDEWDRQRDLIAAGAAPSVGSTRASRRLF